MKRYCKLIYILPIFFVLLSCDPQNIMEPPLIFKETIGNNPMEVVTDNDGRAFVTVRGDNKVFGEILKGSGISAPTFYVPIGQKPMGIAYNNVGKTLYIMNQEGLSISVITLTGSATGNRVMTSITSPVFINLGDGIVSTNGGNLYVATNTDAISIISTTTNTVLQTFTAPSFNYPAYLSADVLKRYIFVSEAMGNAVSVISTTTNSVVKTIGVGISPNGMVQTPDGKWLFVVNSGSDSISVIDTTSLAVARTITDTSFNNPQRIVLTPGCGYGFVSEYNSGNVSLVSQNALITGNGKAVLMNIQTGGCPYDVAIVPGGYDIANSGISFLYVTLSGENAIDRVNYTYRIPELKNVCF